MLLLMLAMTESSPRAIAWGALRAELHRFVARRVPAADVDDVVQEALLRIHRGLGAVRSEAAVIGWMYQVTRNTLADHLRASRPIDSLDYDDLALPIDPEHAAFKSLARCVAPFVAMLPAHYREAIELVELRGASQVQAAAQLGVPVSTMKSRVQRGRAQLRELLDTCCAIDLDARGHVVDVTPRTVCACAASCGPEA
jgi:RNA polymerase sigma-70 factor (ECF subfamily)